MLDRLQKKETIPIWSPIIVVPIAIRCTGSGGDDVVDIVEHKGASGCHIM